MKPNDAPPTAFSPTIGPDGADVSDPESLIGQLVAERYQVEALLGVGGMGCVYRARHIHIRKLVALKTLHAAMLRSPEAVARFEREAVAAAQLDHPNVVHATDFGQLPDGRYFLVLEFLEGRDLRQHIESFAPLSVDATVEIARQIACALGAAHARGIVHRDLKPDNVMLIDRGAAGCQVKVLDFGIAKMTVEDGAQQLTQMGAVFGTPQYMSPEQCKGEAVDARADLYALGVMTYEMLTGKLPFDAPDAMGYLLQHLTVPPTPLPTSVPGPLRRLVHSLLEKEPALRPSSIQEVTTALERMTAPPDAQVIAQPGQRKLDLGHKAKQLLVDLRPLLARPLRVGRFTLSTGIWLLIAVGGLTALYAVYHGLSSSPESDRIASAPPVAAPLPSSDLPSLSKTEFATEVERISQLKVYQRKEQDWMLLARGTAALGQWEESVSAYRALLSLRRTYRSDPGLLADLRNASQDPKAFRVVLNLAETVLGRHGVDLIWEIWDGDRLVPDRKEQADKLAKKLVIIAHRASPALRVAIELSFTTQCEKLLGVLGRAATVADARSLERLKDLGAKTGCGADGKQDCYPCLSDSPLLAQATAQAQANQAPALGQTPED